MGRTKLAGVAPSLRDLFKNDVRCGVASNFTRKYAEKSGHNFLSTFWGRKKSGQNFLPTFLRRKKSGQNFLPAFLRRKKSGQKFLPTFLSRRGRRPSSLLHPPCAKRVPHIFFGGSALDCNCNPMQPPLDCTYAWLFTQK